MTVFVLLREDQNEHGYVDTAVAGIFRDKRAAAQGASLERLRARSDGFVVEDDESSDGDWQVALRIEEYIVA